VMLVAPRGEENQVRQLRFLVSWWGIAACFLLFSVMTFGAQILEWFGLAWAGSKCRCRCEIAQGCFFSMKERLRRINFPPRTNFESAVSAALERGASARDGKAGSNSLRRQGSIAAQKGRNPLPPKLAAKERFPKDSHKSECDSVSPM